ncbi:hypothetical protein [Phytohabitans aurantiacus]|uniref:hypothetical protein n=1 Tax=Phytohabitans aurantiacus TaxID=3016789 RepID=UPI0024917C70|nr:hypothetical protein [Phytohabitans aurantiacus]
MEGLIRRANFGMPGACRHQHERGDGGVANGGGVVWRVSEPTVLDMFTIRGDAERRSSDRKPG